MADNYRQAPQKCQYVKVGAVCEMNGDKWRSLRSLVVAASLRRACLRLCARLSDAVTDVAAIERSNLIYPLMSSLTCVSTY